MKHIKSIATVLFWAIVEIPVYLLGLLVVPLAIPFAREVSEDELQNPYKVPHARLPKWAWPWDNGDEGIYGDEGWRTEHHPDDYASFKSKFLWLAIRNPSFEWAKRFGGVNGVPVEKRVYGTHFQYNSSYPQDSIYDEIRVDNYLNAQGMAYRELDMEDGRTLAQYSFCKAYPFRIKGRSYGLRIQIGPFIQAVQPEQMGTPVRYGHSVLIQPFKEFKHNG
jgi:hypothetical protein